VAGSQRRGRSSGNRAGIEGTDIKSRVIKVATDHEGGIPILEKALQNCHPNPDVFASDCRFHEIFERSVKAVMDAGIAPDETVHIDATLIAQRELGLYSRATR
jgi:hypothetical protein